MKMLKHILSAAALLVMAAACNHDPDELVLPASDLSIANHGKVVVNGLTIDEDFTLTWSAVRFAAPTAVDYTVEAQLSDSYVLLGSTQATHYTCTNSELFGALGISLSGTYNIDFRITATAASGETKQKTLTVPFEYSKITYLWIPGDYQGWNFSNSISRLLQGDDGIFRGFLHLPEGGPFKFASQPNWDGTAYGLGETEGTLNTDAEAGNLSADPGLYYIELDAEALTYVMLPLESVSLIGEGVGGWSNDVEMAYDAASKSWVGFADAAAGKDYKVRFNKAWNIPVGDVEYDCSLGGDPAALAFKGSNLSVEGEGGITAFTLSIFDYPYHISEGAVEVNDEVLYLASSVDEWNYLKAAKLSFLEEGKFYGLANFLGATSPEVLLARLQTPLGPQYGGSASALTEYLGGAEAAPIATAAALNFYAVDLSGDDKVLYETAITDAAVVLDGDDEAAPIAMTADGAGKWTLTHTFAATGKFSIALNGGTITCGGTDYPAVLGGSCTGLKLDGGALNMTKGEHTLVLDLTGAVMTLSIDGTVADLQLYPKTIGVTGDFGDIGWTIATSPQLQGNVETGKYWGYVSMYGLTGFKFTYGDNTWVGGAAVEDAENEFTLGAGDNMMIAEGLYRWDVDLDAMTAKATPLTKVGLIGDGVGTWDDDCAELVRDPEDGLYKAAGVVCPGGEFKIRFNGAWTYSLGGSAEELIDNAGNMPIEAGTYDFALDLTHTPYKVTFTAAQ